MSVSIVQISSVNLTYLTYKMFRPHMTVMSCIWSAVLQNLILSLER